MHHTQLNMLRKIPFTALAIIILVISINSSVQAQHHNYSGLTYGGGGNGGGTDWGISISGGYDVPLGDMGATFKAAPTFAIGVKHNFGNFTFNVNIGLVSYKPKLDTSYVDPADHTAGYVKYDNFSSIEYYAGAAYNIAIADQAKFYFGLDIGSYYNYYSYVSYDGFGYDSADTYDDESYIAPKLGINFLVSDNLSLGIEGKYNFLFSYSSGASDAYNYGYTTTVNKSYSGSVILTYNF
jgi:hypothetical protein